MGGGTEYMTNSSNVLDESIMKYLHNNRWEFIDFCNKCKRVYIYGAGIGGSTALQYLKEEGIICSGVLVSDGKKTVERFHNIDIMEFPSGVNLSEDDGVIISTKETFWDEITNHLLVNSFKGRIFYHVGLRKRHEFIDRCMYVDEKNEAVGAFFDDCTELNQIGVQCGTDKANLFLEKYEFFLKKYKEKAFSLLELGVLNGESLKLWNRYFPQAKIFGVDIDERCRQYASEHINIIISDLSDGDHIEQLKRIEPSIIIDDASHLWSHQIKALIILWDALKNGGIYIMEDIHTSFRAIRDWGYNDSPVSGYDFCCALQEVVTSGEHLDINSKVYPIAAMVDVIERIAEEIDMIVFIRNSCIMIKK